MSSHRFLLRRVWHLAIPTPLAIGYSPTEYAEFTEPPTEMSSRRFLLRRVWHLAIPTPPAIGYSPTEYAEFTEPPTEMSSHGFLLRRVWHLAIPMPPAMGYSPTEYAEFTEPPTEMSSHGFLLRRVWHLAIPTPPAMGYSPTEYAEFTEPPTEMSSHGFLLRRVWHLAIPTPPAMGYSPTEYAEFTESPAEMFSHGFLLRRVWQGCHTLLHLCASVLICGSLFSARSFCAFCAFRAFCGNIFSPTDFLLRRVWHLAIPTPPAMGYSPTEYAEFTEPPTEMFSHGFHRFTQILRVRCSPTEFTEFTEFGSVGIAGMPYPPTSVNICAIRGSPFSARGSVSSVRSVGISFLPQNSQNTQNLAAWVWQGCHTLLICAHLCHLWEALLCKGFCVFRAFRGSFFTACSVGAAETAVPPGGIHGSSVQISPFHLEPSLLHVFPVLWVRLRHHLRLVDAQPGEHDCRRCERHRHAVVVVRVDRL